MHYDYFISLFFLLVASAIFINGLYVVTRGWETKMPDGTVRKEGRLLKGWYFFWNKKTSRKDRYIEFDYKNSVLFIRNQVDKNANIDDYQPDLDRMYTTDTPILLAKKEELETSHGIAIDVYPIKIAAGAHEITRYHFKIFKKESEYVYPEWVRDMMCNCIYCFASFYGSIIFWTMHILALGSDFYTYMYGWANNTLGVIFLTWLVYLASLSYLNGYFYKKINK